MGNSTVTYGRKFEFFQLCARALTTSHQTNFGYIILPNPLDRALFTIMQNHFFVAFTNSEKKERDLRDISWQKMFRRSHAFFSEFVFAT